MQKPRRARELGIVVGTLPTGADNAITDVPGVRVGHTTVVEGTDIRTGVTAVVPDALVPAAGPQPGHPPAGRWPGSHPGHPPAGGSQPAREGGERPRPATAGPSGQIATPGTLAAAVFVGNGHGKMVGSTQIAELGVLETPILLTATLSTFRVADALVGWVLSRPGHEDVRSINPVVAETNDGFLSDIRARPITEAHVVAALEAAAPGRPDEGAVGAGTGTGALGFKAGIGTASRAVPTSTGPATVGVLVQSNFSGTLHVDGTPVPPATVGIPPHSTGVEEGPSGNSCVFVVATDARLDARQLGRVARRAVFALGRVGSDFAGGSGDYAIAFSTTAPDTATLPEAELDPLFAATLEAAEEAILNSLLMAHTTTGRDGHIRYAIPHDRLLATLGLPALS